MSEHELRCWPPYFKAIADGRKPFEIRRNDRPFKVGDTIYLREWDPEREEYSGRECRRVITYVLLGGEWSIPEDLCVLGFTSSESQNALSLALEERALSSEKKEKEYLDDLQRLQADFVNFRRRQNLRREEEAALAAGELIKELLLVVDDLERAMSHNQKKEGMNLVYQKLKKIIAAAGGEEIDTEGKFDPHRHEAIAALPGLEGEIIEVVQSGWMLAGQILRPARVIVGKGE